MNHLIPTEALKKIYSYLMGRPYQEVVAHIRDIETLAKPQSPDQPAPAPKPEEPKQ